MKHANVSIFVPHNGCPHQCSFCDQRTITGVSVQPTKKDVMTACDTAVSSLKDKNVEAEIAFFGGSFTAIDRDYMIELLESAYPYIERGYFKGIRISTRPDYIDDEVLLILKKYGVSAIELGAQSMDENVLLCNNRGHSAEDVINASNLIKEKGFSLGLQMMTGLYKDTDEKCIDTASRIIALHPETVRIYPTILMPDTYLHELFISGSYIPQTLNNAVSLCARLIEMFENENIKVIRVGLHDTDELEEKMIAGPYHPAFRELCESRIFRNKMEKAISGKTGREYTFEVNPKDISKAIGQKKSNLSYFKDKDIIINFKQNENIKILECNLLL